MAVLVGIVSKMGFKKNDHANYDMCSKKLNFGTFLYETFGVVLNCDKQKHLLKIFFFEHIFHYLIDNLDLKNF